MTGDTIFGFERYPKFELGKPRFPQATFLGRYLHFLDVIDPRTLTTSKARLSECVTLLEEFKHGTLPHAVSDRDLWQAQKVKQAILHPDTGKFIFWPFRMSGFVPFGWPTVVGLLLPNPTMAQTVFWQWINQSHNACVNYSNRNASKEQTAWRFLQGYAGAVTVAVSIAVGLTLLIKRAERFRPATRLIVQRFVPLPAVTFASGCNAFLMRRHEMTQGIQVYDAEKTVIGTSTVAAKRAVRDTTITRAFLPAPLVTIPPIIMLFLERTKFLQRRPRLHLPLNSLCCISCFAIFLPIAIAFFPQEAQIETKDLDISLQAKTSEKIVFYNKGL